MFSGRSEWGRRQLSVLLYVLGELSRKLLPPPDLRPQTPPPDTTLSPAAASWVTWGETLTQLQSAVQEGKNVNLSLGVWGWRQS